MKYQLRLIGQDLFSFHAQLSRRCWAVLSTLLPEGGRWGSYRSLRRRLKDALSRRVEAREYCGLAFHCDAHLNPVEPGQPFRKAVPAGEADHTNRYLVTSSATPGQLVGELSRECLLVLAQARPGNLIKGAGRRIHRAIREVLRDHVYRNEACGVTPLCGVSEPVDPWSRRATPGPVQFAGGH
ncbi:MAG TPA: hypothetical protein VJU16_02900 [Planctomycetota bacterium]|nr:hypothetical protein [Planctomycetota bacterium]